MAGTREVQYARAALRCDLTTSTVCTVMCMAGRWLRCPRTGWRRIQETQNGRWPIRRQGVATVRAQHGVAGLFAIGQGGEREFFEHDDGPFENGDAHGESVGVRGGGDEGLAVIRPLLTTTIVVYRSNFTSALGLVPY